MEALFFLMKLLVGYCSYTFSLILPLEYLHFVDINNYSWKTSAA